MPTPSSSPGAEPRSKGAPEPAVERFVDLVSAALPAAARVGEGANKRKEALGLGAPAQAPGARPRL